MCWGCRQQMLGSPHPQPCKAHRPSFQPPTPVFLPESLLWPLKRALPMRQQARGLMPHSEHSLPRGAHSGCRVPPPLGPAHRPQHHVARTLLLAKLPPSSPTALPLTGSLPQSPQPQARLLPIL